MRRILIMSAMFIDLAQSDSGVVPLEDISNNGIEFWAPLPFIGLDTFLQE